MADELKLTDDVTLEHFVNPVKFPVLHRRLKAVLSGASVLFTLAVLAAVIYGLGSEVWKILPHTKSISISAQSNWFVGERKICGGTLRKGQNLPVALTCDDGPQHLIDVKFDRYPPHEKDMFFVWECTRTEVSFSCVVKKATVEQLWKESQTK